MNGSQALGVAAAAGLAAGIAIGERLMKARVVRGFRRAPELALHLRGSVGMPACEHMGDRSIAEDLRRTRQDRDPHG